MSRIRVSFGELEKYLRDLGYASQRTESALVFHQAGKNMLFYRRYQADEILDERDVIVTRRFLDGWGIVADSDFDAFLQTASTPA
jgi:hypothetical protein